MSLVRPQDQYGRSYGDPNFCALTGSGENSSISAPVFNSDKHTIMYATTESCSSESYDLNYFLNSPIEELIHSPSSIDSLTSSFNQMPNSEPLRSNFEAIDHDEEKMRLKLHELERALLGDNKGDEEDDDISNPDQSVMLYDSPKESSSSDSNLSTISSNKEISLVSSLKKTPNKLLFQCAKMVSDGNIMEASNMIDDLRKIVSIQGDPSERISAYMVEALAARVATSGKGLYRAIKCKEPPSNDRLSAMQVLFEVCPCFRFGFMAANGAIIEACKDEKSVHIIDFDINQGSQYFTLIQTLAKEPVKPILRLTGVDDPETVQRSIGGLKLIGQRLEILAEGLKVPFEFNAVASKTEIVSPDKLGLRNGEALIVNFAFQLHHMPDESVSTVNQRDHLLRMVKSMNPKLVTVVEQDINTNTAPFLPRFVEAYNYYSAVFETLEATLPRESPDRLNVEKQCLARDIVNIVACEGEERIERYEVAGKWRARMMMAGFASCPMSYNVNVEIRKLIKQYSERFKVKEETGALHFGWEDKVLIVASAWM